MFIVYYLMFTIQRLKLVLVLSLPKGNSSRSNLFARLDENSERSEEAVSVDLILPFVKTPFRMTLQHTLKLFTVH